MKKELIFLTLIVIVVISLSNCARAETQSIPTIMVTRTPEPSVVATNTTSSTQTATATPQITPTSLPDISADTAKDVLVQFMQTNGGCQLPCLLGLTPGISSQVETDAFLVYFRRNRHPLDAKDNKVGIETSTEKYGAGVRMQFWYEDITTDIGLGYRMDKDVVSQAIFTSSARRYSDNVVKSLYDDANYKNVLEYFSLDNILNTYGPPSEVLIAPFPDDPGHPSPPAQYVFSTVLVYPQKGFLVQYVSVRGQKGEYYFTCPANSYIDVSTWDPKQDFPLSRAVSFFSGVDSINSASLEYFKKIEEATSDSIQSFYEKFKALDSRTCIETKKSLWQTP